MATKIKRKKKNELNAEKETETANTGTETLPKGDDHAEPESIGKPSDDSTPPEPKKETDLDDISSLLNQFADEPIEPEVLETEDATPEKGKRKRRSKKEMESETENVPLVIPPELVTKVLDSAGNALIGLADSYLAPKPLPQKALDAMLLSDEQIKQLNPGAKAFIEYLKLNDHPVMAYFGSLLGMQIANYITVRKIFAEEISKAKNNGQL